jgi:endonuclease/exonuclease/phosphatase family metal-dependent hydrolase
MVLGAMVIFACQSAPMTSLTIVQYNVGVFDKYAESGFDAIASVVKEVDADVVTLNELDSCTVRTGGVYQSATFAQEMGGWYHYFASAMPYNGGAYGVGVVSRPEYEIVRTDKIALPKLDGREPRAVALVEYEDFVLCSTHLDLTLKSQLGQVGTINHYIDSLYADCGKPIFLGGDFNCRPDSEPVALLKKTWTLLTPETVSFPSHAPDRCIDFIFVRPNGKKIIVEATYIPQTLRTADLATASDHLPVVLTVKIQ